MALARAVEAMQRVQAEREKAQAERERVQSELIARLVERLAPAPVMAPRNLREVLDEHLDVTKKIDKLAPRPEPEGDADETVLEKLQPTLEKVVGPVELAIHEGCRRPGTVDQTRWRTGRYRRREPRLRSPSRA